MPSGGRPSVPAIGKRPFKRSLLGYRPSEVEEAVAARDAAIEAVGGRLAAAERRVAVRDSEVIQHVEELTRRKARIADQERVTTRLAERVVTREHELAELREQLACLHEESEQEIHSLAALAAELDRVRRQARGQATRIRLRALRDAAEMSERITELTRRPAGRRERLLDSLQAAIERITGEAVEPEAALALAESNGYVPGRTPGKVFDGMVEVEIGPLSDFSQLVSFEDAAGGIGATSEISVTRFTQGRATLEVKLDQPVELLRELEERAPFEFRVRDTRSDRVVLDVDEDQREAA